MPEENIFREKMFYWLWIDSEGYLRGYDFFYADTVKGENNKLTLFQDRLNLHKINSGESYSLRLVEVDEEKMAEVEQTWELASQDSERRSKIREEAMMEKENGDSTKYDALSEKEKGLLVASVVDIVKDSWSKITETDSDIQALFTNALEVTI